MGDTTLSAGAGSGWQCAFQNTVVPYSHVIECQITGVTPFGIVVKRQGTTHWVIGIDASFYPTVDKYNGSSYTTVAKAPNNVSNLGPGANRVQVMFQQIRYGRETDIWWVASLWINDLLVVTYAEYSSTALSGNLYMGLAVQPSSTVTFANLRIPELTQMAEITTIDPGETPMNALQRIIQGRNLKFFVRFDGTLKAWKPKKRSTRLSFSSFDSYNNSLRYSRHIIKSHIRMIGAYEQAEYARPDLMRKFGYAFTEQNNPYLMSEDECLEEGKAFLRRLEEQYLYQTMSRGLQHFVEVEDRVLVDNDSRIVDSYSVQMGYAPAMDLSMRNYVYG